MLTSASLLLSSLTQHNFSDWEGEEMEGEAGMVTCGKLVLNPGVIQEEDEDRIKTPVVEDRAKTPVVEDMANTPVVDIMMVERISVDSLGMIAGMIEDEEETPDVSEKEESVDPKYVIQSIEKVGDGFEAVFEATFFPENAEGLSEEDIKALADVASMEVEVKDDFLKSRSSQSNVDFSTSVMKFQDAIETYTKTVFGDQENNSTDECAMFSSSQDPSLAHDTKKKVIKTIEEVKELFDDQEVKEKKIKAKEDTTKTFSGAASPGPGQRHPL